MAKLTAKITILNEVNIVIHGLLDYHLKALCDQYAIHAPNYFFNPKFKLGQWDGKIKYITAQGRTYLYLLDEILPIIVKYGYEITIEDNRPTTYKTPELINNQIFAHIKHLDTGKPIILRDDQVNGVNSLIADGNGMCIAGTGAGKTFMCAALVTAYGKLGIKTLTIVPDQTLIRQTKRDYVNCQLDTGEYSGKVKDLDHQHIVSTWQALKNNPAILNQFQLVIVDEAHGLRGNVLQKIMIDYCANVPFRFGFTGTLPKEQTDRMAVLIAVGTVKCNIPAKTLMDIGVLSQLHIDVIQLEEDMHERYVEFCDSIKVGVKPTYTQFKDQYFPDFDSEKSYLQHNRDRMSWIAALIEDKRNNVKGNVLCLVDTVDYARKLASLIPDAIVVNGKDVKKVTDREAIYQMFADHDHLVVIATVHIAGTGLSIRRIFNLVTIDIGKSFTRVIQGIGRGVRTADDKTEVCMTDICSDLKYGKRHLKDRINYYDEAQYPYKIHKVNYSTLMIDE